MSFCHFWNDTGLIGILFSLSLVVIAINQIFSLVNQNLWIFVLILCLSIIIPFYWTKEKTVKIIEKKVTHFSDPDTGDSELHEIITEPLGKIKTCGCLFKSLRDGETVTFKCYGFGIPLFRYFAYDILGKDDVIKNNNNNIKSY
jgi:hypothetical protein